jgi:TRAP-type mannitol/chloroaromatic compound transport system permease small subunit
MISLADYPLTRRQILPSNNPMILSKILHVIDSVNERAASISGWLVAVLVALILNEVISRYVFNAPTTWSFNTFRMVGGAIIVLGWAYAQRHNSHIRVDVFYSRFSPRKKALIDVIGTVLFFFPLFVAFIQYVGSSVFLTLFKLVTTDYLVRAPAGLIYKTIILIGLCLFFLQFVARFMRDVYILTKGKTL